MNVYGHRSHVVRYVHVGCSITERLQSYGIYTFFFRSVMRQRRREEIPMLILVRVCARW